MPQHSHPSTEYARRVFNEQYGRYETYYIVESYENGSAMLGFNVDQARREQWVGENLRARPKVIKWTPDYYIEQFSSLPEMPFHIEIFTFDEFCEYSTEGKYMNVVTLTVGKNITIRSKSDHTRYTTIDLYQAAAIPADFGDYEFVNNSEGRCTVMLIRMKKG